MSDNATAAVGRRPLAAFAEGRGKPAAIALLAAVAVLYPVAFPNQANVDSLANAAIYAALALGLNIVVGFTGLLDLGYAAFFAIGAYAYGILNSPLWMMEASHFAGVSLPNADYVAFAGGLVVLISLEWFLRRTRYGIIIRAGVENLTMVSALGINVARSFTLDFVIGGAMAGLAGLLYAVVFSGELVSPTQGDSLLIFAFIVVVIGGLGSIRGSAVAALMVGLVQDYTNFYLGNHPGMAEIGNLSVVLLLAVVLEWRPRGLFGSTL